MNDRLNKMYARLLCIWLVLMLIITGVYIVRILPAQKRAGLLSSRLENEQNALDKKKQYIGRQNMQHLMNTAKDNRNMLKRFVTEADIADGGFVVSTIARQMKLSEFTSRYYTGKPSTPIPNCNHISMTQINLSWQGTFPQFVRLVNNLERNDPVVFVDSFDLMPSVDTPRKHEINVYLVMLIDDTVKQFSKNDLRGALSVLR